MYEITKEQKIDRMKRQQILGEFLCKLFIFTYGENINQHYIQILFHLDKMATFKGKKQEIQVEDTVGWSVY